MPGMSARKRPERGDLERIDRVVRMSLSSHLGPEQDAGPRPGEPAEAAPAPVGIADRAGTIAPFVVAVGLLGWLAWPVLTWWWWEYTSPESYYSHAPLIPFMALFMLWSDREALSRIGIRPNAWAICVVGPALGLLVFALKEDARALQSLGLLTTIWGGAWLALGSGFVRRAWLPLAFLALMMPLPGPLLNDGTLSLQTMSTALASRLLNLLSFANVQQGNMIAMRGFQLFVDVPCSGFKTLLALVTFNGFLAAMLDGSVLKRVMLFTVCAPLALVDNAVRIALIGIVGEWFGANAARTFHDYSGLLTLVVGFTVLFWLAKSVGCRKFAGLAIF
jgi:exosortase